ncbi:hypothetical protein ANCCEY_07246 [Ancylostoma ceylanicum]|uniref:Uncharacterized protein n=1 Tax=Ancylostoma ceylanicum TaxID=53326 RepID=A0A0D6LNK2_9BILA|nr:hypothetical protein ANCCEY_07246 [Ancylostoma ceylanicum]
MVDNQPTIDDVLRQFHEWMSKGRLHSGIDDVKSICTITSAIGKEGYVYRINGSTSDKVIRRRVFKNVTVQ